jgi:hypothetical protein
VRQVGERVELPSIRINQRTSNPRCIGITEPESRTKPPPADPFPPKLSNHQNLDVESTAANTLLFPTVN